MCVYIYIYIYIYSRPLRALAGAVGAMSPLTEDRRTAYGQFSKFHVCFAA